MRDYQMKMRGKGSKKTGGKVRTPFVRTIGKSR